MFALFRTISYRYLLLRRSRAALVVISILLGVALLVATRTLIQSMLSASNENLNPFARAADLIVMNGETGVPGELVKEIEQAKIAGVVQVEPLVVFDCGLVTPQGGEHVRMIGIRSDLQSKLMDAGGPDQGAIAVQLDRDTKLEIQPGIVSDGSGSTKSWNDIKSAAIRRMVQEQRKPAVVGKEFAAKLADDSGAFTLLVSGRPCDLWGVGTVTAGGKANFLSGNTVVLRDDDASALFYSDPGRKGFRTRIHIMCNPSADKNAVRRDIEQIVAGRADVVTPDENDAAFRDIGSSLEIAFTLVGYLALLVGLFLVYISLAVSVAERRQDIGMLRSLGATRSQIAGLFAGEALLLGTVGSLLGIPLGWGLARFAIGPIQQVMSEMFVPMEGSELKLHWGTILLAFGSGVATALLAALVPALQAAQEEPADAVRRLPYRSRKALQILYIGSCAFLMLLGLALLLARDALPDRVGRFGGIIILMLGAMTATPLVTRGFSALVRPLAHRLLQLHGRLAVDNLARSPARTGLVIAVLGAGVALLVETAGMKVGTEKALVGWIDDQIPADLFVTAFAPVTKAGTTLPMDENLGQTIANDPDLRDKIDHVIAFRMHIVNFRDKLVLVVAFDADEEAKAIEARKRPIAGSNLFPELAKNHDSVLVSDNFASQYNVKEGDQIEVLGRKGTPISFHVVGSINDFTWNRGTIFMDRKWFKEEFGASQVDLFHVYVRQNIKDPQEHAQLVAEVQQALEQKWQDRELHALTRPEFRDGLRDLLVRFFRISYAQLLVVALVVSLGVVSALLISVLQRRRELGLLRAVGASRTQVVLSVLSEAMLMGFFGSLIGLGVGLLLHWLSLQVLLQEESGFVFPFVIPWVEAGIVMALAMLVATAAGLLPAVRAMRLNIAEAIAYE